MVVVAAAKLSGVLLLLTYQWGMGIQLAFFGLFGLFSAFTCKRDFLRLVRRRRERLVGASEILTALARPQHSIFSLFYFLAVLGYMSFLGYGSLYTSFDGAAPTVCNKYARPREGESRDGALLV